MDSKQGINTFQGVTMPRRKLGEKRRVVAQVAVIPNPDSNPLAENPDFMKALSDFQYGEDEETVERGFTEMIKHGTPKE